MSALLNNQQDDDYYEDKIMNLKAELATYSQEIMVLLNGIYGTNSQSPSLKNNKFDDPNKYDLKNNPLQMIQYLKLELNELVQQSQENSNMLKRFEKDLNYCNELIGVLVVVSKIIELFNSIELLLSRFKFIDASQALIKLEAEIQSLPKVNNDINSGFIYKIIRNEKNLIRLRFKNLVKRIFRELIIIEFGSMKIHKRINDYLKCEERVLEDSIFLKDILITIINLDLIEDVLEDFIDNFWRLVLLPMWKEKKIHAPSITTSADYSEFILASILRGVDHAINTNENFAEVGLGQTKQALPDLFNHVGQLLSFIWSEIFLSNDEFGQVVGEKLSADPYNVLAGLDNVISLNLPKNETDIPAFKRSLEDCCKNLDTRLNITVRKYSGQTNMILSEYITNLSSIYASLRRKEILKHARDLVLLDYHNAMIGSGDVIEDDLSSAGDIGDPKALLDQSGNFAIQKLKFDSCQISLAACRLLKFVHDIMKQSMNASPEISNLLFHSARDCLEIFIAIIPIKFDEIINTIPRMGAIFYNDCLYIAHNTILLTYQYRSEFQKQQEEKGQDSSNPLQGSIGFIDFIPRLRKLGDACIRNHLSQQENLLAEMVKRIAITPDRQAKNKDQSNNENNNSNPSGQTNPRKMIGTGLIADRIADRFKNKFLKTVNPDPSNKSEASSNDVSDSFLNFEEEEEISNDESRASILVDQLEKLSTQWLGVLQELNYARFMGFLIDKVLKDLMFPVLHTECITETAASEIYRIFKIIQRAKTLLPNDDSNSEQHWRSVCPSWEKFLALTDMLEFNLNDIADGLSRKKFVSFTGQEMIHLIKALFEDSPRRESLINSIAEISS